MATKKEPLFHIDCPCQCGRTIAVEFKPEKISEKNRSQIKHLEDKEVHGLGNMIWQRMVNARGLEGAIQFLHERSED